MSELEMAKGANHLRRSVELVGLAVAAQVVAVSWNGSFQGISLLTDSSEPIGIALTMTVIAVMSGGLAWRSFSPTPASPLVGVAFVLVGAVMTFAWPLAFASAAPWVDIVATWGTGPALPQLEGAMTATIGAGLLFHWLLTWPRGAA